MKVALPKPTQRSTARTRPPRVAEKQALRQQGLQTPGSIPFPDLVKDSLYQRVVEATCPPKLKTDLESFGFDSPAEVASYRSVNDLETALVARAGDSEMIPMPDHSFFVSAQKEAVRAYRLMRHLLAVKDPMNQALRHTSTRITSEPPNDSQQAMLDAGEMPIPSNSQQAKLDAGGLTSYAKPSSLQSNQSTAAYLRYLYRIATGLDSEIGLTQPESGPMRLQERRPDLADLVLSETHLKQEIPTIDLVNEVLEAGLGTIDLKTSFRPVSLPFDESAATTRAALSTICGMSINSLGERLSQATFPLDKDFVVMEDLAGPLGLVGTLDTTSSNGSELALLTEDENGPLKDYVSTFGDIHEPTDIMLAVFDLEFDELAQLLGLYSVRQENGQPVAQRDFATVFLDNDSPFAIAPIGADGETLGVVKGDTALSAPDIRSLNYLARLHHGTGLAFHHLNMLLAVPGAAAAVDTDADENRLATRRVTVAGLKVLAGYTRFRDAFGLEPEAYAALFGELSPFWRADEVVQSSDGPATGLEQTEISFLRKRFGDDALWLHRTISAAETPITHKALAVIVCRGLGISNLELEALITVLDANFHLKKGLDARGLAALYRLSTLFRLLGWSVLTGLGLLECIAKQSSEGQQLWVDLITRNEDEEATEKLCDALSRTVALGEWMTEAELSADMLLSLLSPPTVEGAIASDDDGTWFADLESAATTTLVGQETFRSFERWDSGKKDKIKITSEEWHVRLTEDDLYRSSGVFVPGADREVIEKICRNALTVEFEVDLSIDDNAEQLQRLVTRLEQSLDEQGQALERQVANLSTSLSAAVAGVFCLWAQSHPLSTLDVLLNGADDTDAIIRLHELRRHANVLDAIGIGDIEVLMLGSRPELFGSYVEGVAGMPRALDLEQLHDLQRFTTLQVGAASDAAWFGYLSLATDGRPKDDSSASDEEKNLWRTTTLQAMAALLGCSTSDATTYVDTLFGTSQVPIDTRQIDAVARYVRLAKELHVGATELLQINAVSSSYEHGDWDAAADASKTGLAQFDAGRQMKAFHNTLAEGKRDALVGAYMKTRVACDEVLAANVRDSEELYTHLLLDVNVTSSVPTSRLVEAVSSLQLYITRVLSGLELGVQFKNRSALAAQWQLNREYRKWEANQKLLLYPQNYIEPELRYLASPEFTQLRSAISGDDTDEDTVEQAVNAYMGGLAAVCDLRLCSLFVERNGETATYHFLASAQWERGRFFYRRLDADYKAIAELTDPTQYLKAFDWTYWQEVVIPNTYPIFSDVTVCVFRNRYYFLWLEIEEQTTQTPDGETTIWRIHPRYMRCDANALTGTMHTPSLFGDFGDAAKTIEIGGELLKLGEAYRWEGNKPKPGIAYHPLAVTGAFAEGEVYVNPNESEPQTVVDVRFGIVLENTSGDTTDTTLRIRLADLWADAMYFPTDAIESPLNDAAPEGFSCIRPGKVWPSTTMVGGKVPSNRLSASLFHDGFVESTRVANISVENEHFGQATISTFKPLGLDSPSLGSVHTTLDLGHIAYRRKVTTYNGVDPNGYLEAVREYSPSETWTRQILTFKVDGEETKTFKNDWSGGKMPLYVEDIPNMRFDRNSSASTVHVADAKYIDEINLPDGWELAEGQTAKLHVKMEVRKVFGAVQFDVVVDGRAMTVYTWSVTHAGTAQSDVFAVDVGTFTLQRTNTQLETGWALTGAHGSQNFAHITANVEAPVAETFVLSNSSTALTTLAESVPRPGGATTLFTLENQRRVEELGTFVDDFENTLREAYEDPTMTLNRERTPAAIFDFDAAYGVYGWEIFYHVPSAIAASYTDSGHFDKALEWLQRIFDPGADQPWRVDPLIGARPPTDGMVFETGEVIVDPDRIATDYPFYYQQAVVRQYLETMLAAGDAAYLGLTQETLQQAKATYVAAKSLFADNLSETLSVLTQQSWVNPTLSTASADGFDGFLPPYNDDLRTLYDTLEERLENLRRWLDIDGEPLNVPLLAAPIDPSVLQKTAKAALTLKTATYSKTEESEPAFDFPTVLRSTKGYVENLKTTSSRLQAAITNLDGANMEAVQLRIGQDSARRAAAMQELIVGAAQKNLDVAEANLVGANSALAHHVSTTLVSYATLATISALRSGFVRGRLLGKTIMEKALTISGNIKSVIPRVFGFSNGGQQFEQADVVTLLSSVGDKLTMMIQEDKFKLGQERALTALELSAKTVELSVAVASANDERDKARAGLAIELLGQSNLAVEIREADEIFQTSSNGFTGTAFYGFLVDDLKLLFADEWAATQDLCRLLIRIYEDETGEDGGNGAGFLRTISLGNDYERFNAPHRLALDLERLETAYLRAVLDLRSQTSTLSFELAEINSLGGQCSVLESLLESGETYFELTDEMFDSLYPGQYDRRIQSVRVRFPGLAEAGLNPHARLTQISNTRYATRERDQKRGGKVLRNRYPLQSVVLGSPDVNTEAFDAPQGMLKRFQNTGVESRWHLTMPAVLELKSGAKARSRAWQEQASRHFDTLKPHLSSVVIDVSFSGRW